MKIFKYTLLALIILIATMFVSLLRPPMHKAVKIENANLEITEQNVQNTVPKEEKVAWNNWYSALSNKILKEKGAPQKEALNVRNLIQFNVDNKRNIFNIKIVTEPPEYTKMAQDYYIEYLNSLNGNPILEFPKDSKRNVIFYKIPLTTSTFTKYSTPKDFTDNEIIQK